MVLKFKSFYDYCHVTHNEKFGQNFQTQEYATKQVEKFIKENNIQEVRDIKFSIDAKGNEHILIVYWEDEGENKNGK